MLGTALGVLLLAALAVHLIFAHYTSAGYVARHVAGVLGLPSDTLVQIGATRLRPFTRSFRVSALTIVSENWEASVASLEVTGVHLGALLRGARIAAAATLEEPRLDARLDRRTASRTGATPWLLHEAFRGMSRTVRVDTVRVRGGAVRYEEIAADGVRPGILVLDRIFATAYNVTNDPRRMSDSTRAVADVQMRLAGEGSVKGTLAYDLLAPSLTMRVRGTVGRMPGPAFNTILVDLEGIRVTSGTLDSAWFDVRVRDEAATGHLTMLYHDLGIELLNKVTHARSIGDRVQSFIGANFRLNRHNPSRDGAEPTTVPLARARGAEVALTRFIWETVREGVKTTLGL